MICIYVYIFFPFTVRLFFIVPCACTVLLRKFSHRYLSLTGTVQSMLSLSSHSFCIVQPAYKNNSTHGLHIKRVLQSVAYSKPDGQH